MAKLIFLGTANAIADAQHENTHLLLVGDSCSILIDCPNSPFLRFQKVGFDFTSLTDLLITHFHPDHASGVPQLLISMWLMGRQRPFEIYGLDYTLDRLEELMELYGWTKWPGFYPVKFIRIPERAGAQVLDCADFRITSTPVKHFIPTTGLRIEFLKARKTVAYSCDTEPCAQVVQLAAGVDVLIHESTGPVEGHSSAAQAGAVAQEAEAGSLYLVHYPNGQFARPNMIAEAGKNYKGPIRLAEDFMTLDFS